MEIEGFNEYADGLNAKSIILELRGDETIACSKGEPIMENDPLSESFPTLSRSYSFGSSGNEHCNFTSRDSRTHLLDSLSATDSTTSPCISDGARVLVHHSIRRAIFIKSKRIKVTIFQEGINLNKII